MHQICTLYGKHPTTYRLTRKPPIRRRKALTCPVCNCNRLIDIGENTQSKTYKPGDSGYDTADYYQKCHHCGSEIGISKL